MENIQPLIEQLLDEHDNARQENRLPHMVHVTRAELDALAAHLGPWAVELAKGKGPFRVFDVPLQVAG